MTGMRKRTHGEMQFTRIDRSPTSLAADLDRPITAEFVLVVLLGGLVDRSIPCFEAVYAAFFGKPMIPAIEDALTIEPPSFMF